MVSVAAYGQSLRDEFDMNSDDGIRCLTDILPYAVHQCLTLLRPSKDGLYSSLGQRNLPHYNQSLFHESLSSLSANPFGPDANISKAISLILGLPSHGSHIGLKPLPDDVHHFNDLPALQNYLAALKLICKCGLCDRRMIASYQRCVADNFLRGIAALVLDILCLSFFENLEELSVSLYQDGNRTIGINLGLFDLLTQGGHQSYNALDFYDWALALVGHSNRLGKCTRPILSSAKGQITYLKLFETNRVVRRGYLTLAWTRGVLRFESKEYRGAIESAQSFPALETLRDSTIYKLRGTSLVISPQNLYEDYSMEWITTPKNGILELNAVCSGVDQVIDIPVQPLTIVENLARSLIMEGCEHRSDTPLSEPDAAAML